MIDDPVARLDRWLAANRADYYAELRPGVTDQVLDAFEARFGVHLPDAFRLLYKWRNGQNPMHFESFQNNWMFSSLADITVSKEILDGMIGYDFTDPKWWRKEWIPFLHNGGGDHLCLDPMARDFGKPMQLIVFWHDWEDRSVKYESIESWLADLVRSMEERTLVLE
jgi:cell wall assembly regulator SMI1